MEFNDYQRLAKETAIYPKGQAIAYLALGLAGEAGEVANKAKKFIRDDRLNKEAIAAELGDVLWYVAMLADELGCTLGNVAYDNILKLRSRKHRGKLGGSGDDR